MMKHSIIATSNPYRQSGEISHPSMRDCNEREELLNAKFLECLTCAAKAGTPLLCESCLNNRMVIFKLQEILR